MSGGHTCVLPKAQIAAPSATRRRRRRTSQRAADAAGGRGSPRARGRSAPSRATSSHTLYLRGLKGTLTLCLHCPKGTHTLCLHPPYDKHEIRRRGVGAEHKRARAPHKNARHRAKPTPCGGARPPKANTRGKAPIIQNLNFVPPACGGLVIGRLAARLYKISKRFCLIGARARRAR